MRKRILALLGTIVLGLGLAVAVSSPASAHWSDCGPQGPRVFCVWKNPLASGTPSYYWTWSAGSGGFCVNYSGTLNDQIDALELNGARSVTQYRDANCSGNTVSTHVANGGTVGGVCGNWGWSCVVDGGGGWLPSSAWIIK